jgi:thiamine kinase-like enzyme
MEAGANTTIAREAALYQFFSACPDANELRKYLPKYCGYDRRENLLICELLSGAQTLWKHQLRTGRCSVALATQIGSALAALHRLTRSAEADKALARKLHHDHPWILSFHEPTLAMIDRMSAANLKLVRIIQQFGNFGESLERLHSGWRRDTLLHFDLKADNWLVLRPHRQGRFTRLNLVDWELAGIGDAAWDIGSVLADYLSYWLLSIPGAELPPDGRSESGGVRLATIQPAARAFWKAYVQRMPLGDEADQWLVRSVEYAAARLLQSSYEQMHMSLDLWSNVVFSLQVSENMFQRPAEAAVRLLGLPLRLVPA